MDLHLKQRFALIASLLLLCVTQALAGVKITGTVVDESGEPLMAATVAEVGTTRGTVTDANGKFSLEVNSSNSVLLISYVGYTPVRETVGSRNVLNVTLKAIASTLQETIVIGYGRQKKADVTSAVQSVRADDFHAGAVNDAG